MLKKQKTIYSPFKITFEVSEMKQIHHLFFNKERNSPFLLRVAIFTKTYSWKSKTANSNKCHMCVTFQMNVATSQCLLHFTQLIQ